MRLIDADNLVSLCEIMADKTDSPQIWEQIISMIESVPTIEAEPVRHGRWLDAGREDPCIYYCSECHHMTDLEWPYCAECGARMESEE